MVWSCAVTSFRFFGRLFTCYEHCASRRARSKNLLFLYPWLQTCILLALDNFGSSSAIQGRFLLAGFVIEKACHDDASGTRF